MKNKKITNISIIIAIYVALCLLLEPLSFGFIQFRISEILCLLAIEFPYAIIANTIGCFIANMLFGGLGIVDVIFGSLATFLGCEFAYILRNKRYKGLPLLSCLAIVLINGIIVGIELGILSNNINMIPLGILEISISELIVMIIGLPIYNKLIDVIRKK